MFLSNCIFLSGLFFMVIILVSFFGFKEFSVLLIFRRFVLFIVVFKIVFVGDMLVLIIRVNFWVLLLWVDILLFVLKVIFMFDLWVLVNVFCINGLMVVVLGWINVGK